MSISYTKTAWVNGTSPAINATNLKNIEDTMEIICTGGATSGLAAQFLVSPDGTELQPSSGSTILWTNSNDGSLSGLDADLLDGQHAAIFTYQYQAGRTYALNDTCTYNGVTYKSLQAGNIGQTPSTATTFWAYTAPALSGDVVNVVTGTGSAATIQANVVDNTKLADMATATIKGRVTALTGDPEDLTATQVAGLLTPLDITWTGTQNFATITTSSTTQVTNLFSSKTKNIDGGAAGSLPYQSGVSTTSMLTIGGNGTVLTSNGSGIQWTSSGSIPSGSTATITGGDAGQIVYQSAPDSTNFTATGTAGQLLSSGGAGAPTWTNQSNIAAGSATTATTATNIAGGGAGRIPYQTGAGATTIMAAGTSGQVLLSGGTGAPTWSSIITGTNIRVPVAAPGTLANGDIWIA